MNKEYIKKCYAYKWEKVLTSHYLLVDEYHEYAAEIIGLITRLFTVEGKKILDVGCGTGQPYAESLARRGASVVGIDLAEYLVRKLKNTIDRKLNITPLVGDSEVLPFASGCFDAVICIQSSWYFPNFECAIYEMLRVLKTAL